MLKTLGIVEACYGSTGPGSKATRRLAGKPVLEWVVRRVTDCQQLEGVIVVTRDTPEHRAVTDLVPTDVPVFFGRQPDALSCLAAALEDYQAESAVRISAGCLFIDPMLIDRLVVAADENPGCDYVSYCCRDGRPAILSPVGIYGEWFRTAALFQAVKKATAAADRENPTRYVYSHPERFSIRLLPAPPQIDREDVRLTVDIEEDWDHALTIFDALGTEEFDWRRIATLLNHQPALRERMAVLNRVHAKG
jgi:spore coat polysaccharide biosynthesis protein SpsF